MSRLGSRYCLGIRAHDIRRRTNHREEANGADDTKFRQAVLHAGMPSRVFLAPEFITSDPKSLRQGEDRNGPGTEDLHCSDDAMQHCDWLASICFLLLITLRDDGGAWNSIV